MPVRELPTTFAPPLVLSCPNHPNRPYLARLHQQMLRPHTTRSTRSQEDRSPIHPTPRAVQPLALTPARRWKQRRQLLALEETFTPRLEGTCVTKGKSKWLFPFAGQSCAAQEARMTVQNLVRNVVKAPDVTGLSVLHDCAVGGESDDLPMRILPLSPHSPIFVSVLVPGQRLASAPPLIFPYLPGPGFSPPLPHSFFLSPRPRIHFTGRLTFPDYSMNIFGNRRPNRLGLYCIKFVIYVMITFRTAVTFLSRWVFEIY